MPISSEVNPFEVIPAPPTAPASPNRPPVSTPLEMAKRVRSAATANMNDSWNNTAAFEWWAKLAANERDKHGGVADNANIAVEILSAESGKELSNEAREYFKRGGSISELLGQLEQYDTGNYLIREPLNAVDQRLVDSRRDYVTKLLKRKKGLNVGKNDEKTLLEVAEKEYFTAVLEKLKFIVESPPERAQLIGQYRQIVEKLSFGPDIKHSVKELAENHMHVLIDLLLREQIARQMLVEDISDKGVKKILSGLKENAKLKGAVVGTVFAGSAASMFSGHLPGLAGHIGEAAGEGFKYIAAYFSSRQLLESAHRGIEGIVEGRHQEKTKEKLATDPELADLTMRTAYGGLEARDVEQRQGSQNPRENRRRFDEIAKYLVDMKTAPGGRPYRADALFKYMERLYLKDKGLFEEIAKSEDQQSAYFEFASRLLAEDLEFLSDDLTLGRLKRGIYKGVSVLAAVAGGKYVGQAKSLKGDLVVTPTALPKDIVSEFSTLKG